MDKFDDISLVTQVAVFHNRQSFDKLVRKYQSPVRRFLLNQTGGDSQLSDDLAQDTFMKAYTRIGQFQGKASFLTWLYRIAYNVYYDYMRSLHSTQDIDAVPASARAKGNSDSGLKMDLQGGIRILSVYGGMSKRDIAIFKTVILVSQKYHLVLKIANR